jgi:heptosyltransferase-2
MKILVIQQKMIGDVLLSTLICKNLKLWNSKITVDFIANRHTLDVIRHNPYIDEIVVFEDDFKKNKWGFFKFLLNQRNKKYDYIIDCYGKLESLLICAFTPTKKKIGFKKINTLLVYNHSIQRKTKQDSALQLSTVNRFQLLEPIMGDAPKKQRSRNIPK